MSNYCKYYKQQKQVSYDSGQTWSNVVPAEYQIGSLYEMDSMDCTHGSAIIRWVVVPGDFLCEGKDKYEKEIEQYSTDNGVTWMNVYPTTYRKGKLIEPNSSICDNKWEGHYYDDNEGSVNPCPSGYKWVEGVGCVYVDPVKIIRCSSSPSSTLTQSDVRYNPYVLFEGTIGDCVTSIGSEAFMDCTSLVRLNSDTDGVFNIPDNVTSIGDYAFSYCSNLTSIVIPSGVTSIGSEAFSYCSNLTSCTIGSGVTSIGNSAFQGCTSLTSIDIPSGVTSIGNSAFWYCTGLSSITISNGVTSIDRYAFEGCSSLTGITIPDSVTSIGNYAFNGCTGLTGITIGSGITAINGYAFANCSGLASITVNATTPPTLGSSAFYDTNCSIYVPCASVDTYKAASGWSNYTSRIQGLPPCVEPKKLTAMNNNSSIYTVFCNTSSTLTYDEVRANNAGYERMVTAIIGDCVTIIGNSAFYGCYRLNTVTISDSVRTIDIWAFRGCSGLTSVVIPDSVRTIDIWAFDSCYSLSSVTIGSGVTSIGENAFYDCSGLTTVIIGSGVTTISGSAFGYCYSLTSITIPDSVTTIGGGAFSRCSGLTTVIIGSGVTSIGGGAFRDCTSLTSITVKATTPPTIGVAPFYNTNCQIYVPAGSVEAYKSASDWSNYASIIQPIP